MITGIDVSKWQGPINFEAVKSSGIKFVIIKAGGSDAGFYTDPMFEKNYDAAKAAGLMVGAYYFAGPKFMGAENGKADAVKFAKILGKRTFEMPVYLDIEAQPTGKQSEVTDAAVAFCSYMESKKFYAGIYASDVSGFCERLQLARVLSYTLWSASYGRAPKVAMYWGMWQYTSTGSVKGITGNTDMDQCKYDFASVIKKQHLNNY